MISLGLYENHLAILQEELLPALGCTEPAAVALAAARARQVLGAMPEYLSVACSGNVIKNVQGVQVPNSQGLKGIEAAAVLGVIGGDADAGLQVLQSVRPDHIREAVELLKTRFCRVGLLQSNDPLHIQVDATAQGHQARVEISGRHDHFSLIEYDQQTLAESVLPVTGDRAEDRAGDKTAGMPVRQGDRSLLTIRNILDFADAVRISDIREILDRQINYHTAISDEGLRHDWGAGVGQVILSSYGKDVRTRARARAAAGSDARMGGCALPVIINSGSGNQGLALSLPVIEYAREMGDCQDRLYRALVVSNLVAIRQKNELGRLSAYCGAVSAAAGSGAGIAYLHGLSYNEIADTISNTIVNVGGMVCDGAKPSCAAKISSAVDAAILAFEMSRKKRAFAPGEGLVKADIEQTIASVGQMGRDGMRETDRKILQIMLN